MRISVTGLKARLLLSYVIAIAVALTAAAIFLDRKLEDNSLRQITASLVGQARLIESLIPPGPVTAKDYAAIGHAVRVISPRTEARITIINGDGTVLADSEKDARGTRAMENHLLRPEIQSALHGATGIERRYSPTLRIPMLYVTVPVKNDGEVAGVLRLALPLTEIRRELSAVRRTVMVGLFLALVFSFALASLMTASVVRPLHRIMHGARRFSKGDFGHAIVVHSKDEMGELAATLNAMAREIEEKIRQIELHNQHLGAILQSMVEGIIVVDRSGTILSLNGPAARMFGVRKQDAEGRLFLEAIRSSDIADLINEVITGGFFESREVAPSLAEAKVFRVNASPVFEKETIRGCVIVIHDITESRRLETMRRDFVANVSHELKTPLTSIKGFVETLAAGALEERENARHFLGIIQAHTDRLDRLVDDLLSLSRLESNQIVLKKEAVLLRQVTEEILARSRFPFEQKHIEVKDDLPADLAVSCDREKIGQVIANLIDNAIKFNREGGTVRISGRRDDGTVTCRVEDTGIGIPRKDVERIFERFYRVDKARSREMGGTGLGLSIVKHTVELHGGTVGVESTEGAGSAFFFTLPA